MKVTFLQTSDPHVYYPMLQATAQTVRRYCLLNGFDYEQYVGIKRGYMPWQSTFNRIYMLKELLDRGVEGWAFYLDADAFIIDMRFDLIAYLADKARYGAIFAGHISDVYDVNAGGFAVNLSHPAGKALILEYHAAFEATLGADFDRAILWDHDVINDQYLLYLLLKRWYEELDFKDMFLFEHTNRSYVNNGPFITQQLRAFYPNFGARVAAIRARVARVLANAPSPHNARGQGIHIPAGHPRLTTECGNKHDVGIFTTGTPGAFLRGPQVRLEPGRYCLQIHGRAASEVPASRVVAGGGQILLSSCASGPSQDDMLVEHGFDLAETLHDVTVQIDVGAEHHLCVHAVQIMTMPEAAAHPGVGQIPGTT